MKLISVIIAWCSCKSPGRSHLLFMVYTAHVFAGAPTKQTGLQKLVRCTPVLLLPTPMSNASLFLPPDIFHTSCYRHQRATLSLTISLHLRSLIHLFCHQHCPFQCPRRPKLGKSCTCHRSAVQGDQVREWVLQVLHILTFSLYTVS